MTKTVLVVEDDNLLRELIRLTLQRQGDFSIHFADNGKDAVIMTEELLPDIFLMDVMLPDLDGYDACRLIKSGELTSKIPVVFLTARRGKEIALEAREVGAQGVIHKPFDPLSLGAKITSILEKLDKESESGNATC